MYSVSLYPGGYTTFFKATTVISVAFATDSSKLGEHNFLFFIFNFYLYSNQTSKIAIMFIFVAKMCHNTFRPYLVGSSKVM